jgi:hypothetical protein
MFSMSRHKLKPFFFFFFFFFYKMEQARLRILEIRDCIAALTAAWKTSGRPLPVLAEHSKYLQCNVAATAAPYVREESEYVIRAIFFFSGTNRVLGNS